MRKKMGEIILHGVMILLALIWIYPYVWLFLSSIKPPEEIFTRFFPSRITLEHYKYIFTMAEKMERPFLRAFFNSLFVTLTVTFSVVFTSSIIAYGLSKLRFKGSNAVFNFIIFQMLFPGFMFIIPLFVLIRKLGLYNTYSAMIVPFLMSAWSLFMLTQSYKTIPQDYIEAAKIDGASTLWIIFRVMVPLSRSTLSIVGLFTFIGIWDNFLWPLMVVKDYNKMPLSVLLATFNHEYAAYVGPLMAGSVIQTLPMVLIFLIFRKQFLQGISMSFK
ncbi:sugar ABC transporter permease [Thermotoga maritima MSB8]|uniref:Sugar ABC transporter, permease protein n=1 Tax=Thermotoga maritima (strain ATCC 43589 / DSM 3109 / JCM 10099 / NBRC 100826 / MSB8) TaxID=243274 RepID=Q9X2G8_THEMA|nr:carbohydrate ABC transporter permease [Thermotoga maritima]AAD36915.1 sugar ABC transporter, permease protein [Thermotoga maritima MSB8]AGL50792.1 Sugar ABC transporter, permease protein precursor [Thermotoga maritima MSB8]AHD18250.1 sugar ABC transporter permease [Thermotoga maritima MSB8]AKE27734.1 sugar ABC transporter permease [Thermotoga maritima]AKE29609.1 sugar ABC transporter permease [Thermotoga maritima MSB8]